MRALAVLFFSFIFSSSIGMVNAQTASLGGRVYDHEGDVLENITVKLVWVENGEQLPPVKTDAQGNFYFESLAPGMYTIEFYNRGYTSEPYAIKIEDETESDAVAIGNVIYVCATTWGWIYDNENQPLDTAEAEIKLTGKFGTWIYPPSTQTNPTYWPGWTEPEPHRFSFLLLPADNYTLTIEHPDYEIYTSQFEVTHVSYFIDRLYLQPRIASLVISPESFSLRPGESVVLTATLSSLVGPLGNRSITWKATAGTFSPESGITDGHGRVQTTYTAPMTENRIQVTTTASYAGDDYPAVSRSVIGTIAPPGILERLKGLMVPWGIVAIAVVLIVIAIVHLVLRFLARRAVPEAEMPEELEF